MKIRLLAAAVIASALPSCVVPSQSDAARTPQWSQVNSVDYGSRPQWTPQLKAMAIKRGKQFQKDPNSTLIEFGEARKYVRFNPNTHSYSGSYVLPYSVNGKNSFGAYTGAFLFGIEIRNGQVRDSMIGLAGDLFDRTFPTNVNGFAKDYETRTYHAIVP